MSAQRRFRTTALAVGASATLVAASGCSLFGTEDPEGTTEIQLLALNDFHGNLEANEGMGVTVHDEHGEEEFIEAGGAEYLATHLDEAREGFDNTLTVAAGDLIGASPFLSAAFDDQPTLDSLYGMGLDVSSVGNHEFDQGIDELQRLIHGGCPDEGCADGQEWEGMGFPYLGANVVDAETGEAILDATYVHEFDDGATVGFIGMTLEGTADIVAKSGIEGIEFRNEVETANEHAQALLDDGVNAIVVLLHEGGYPAAEDADNQECETFGDEPSISGPIVDMAENMDSSIDLIVTGHTHRAYVCTFEDPNGEPRMVTSAGQYGTIFSDIRMEYDFETSDIIRTSVEGTNIIVERNVEADPVQTGLIDGYNEALAPIAQEVVGHLQEPIMLGATRAEEFALGNLIADVQLARTAEEELGGAQIAFMNPGGVRADLIPNDEGEVTYEQVFTVQPFGNYLVTMDLTGDQIVTLLQQQYTDRPNEPLILLPSEGFTYTLDESQEGEDKVLTDSLQLNGEDIEADQTYRVTVNSFLADGGDSFTVLTEGQNVLYGEVDVDAFKEWLQENTSADDLLAAPALDRITIVD
ncbi:bifunctional metallophosphatase/5'-nucleotidase [Natronoglycomyces albus]|uniref:Bifunctional metallophosphatase/5'-nucleotidase n=1 Tax=Natronoglycomyces albus TaxID=2811108 RepID=A0A895XNY5_9ACTN|nr:bifunctional metallophosphatase/5'-nucleotidase [Natronoglycomyces albus]QSB06847.1 bifunctional metallophosphatase/5'-nucleotidase [Natronoglycomyces albus]